MVGRLVKIGGACGRKGRFFKEKAPQKPFWEKVFWGWWEWVRTWRLLGLGAVRPVFAEGKDRQWWAFLLWAHFSFLGGYPNVLGIFELGFVGVPAGAEWLLF